MAKLILSLEGSVLREVPLDKERITIGRKPHNDIKIDNLAVSGEHACIVTILDDSFLEDLGSTNGTLVNGNPIKKHILQNNDLIEIGKYRLKYVSESPASGQSSVKEFEKTMELRSLGTMSGPGPAAAGPAARGPESLPTAAILILTGPSAGKELELTKNLTTVGKPGVQVAVITRRPQGYFITHVEGANRPTVNGQQIGAAPHSLKDHDVIELAGVKMEFFLKG